MKNERFEIILHRNQKNVIVDLVLAVVFLFAALTTAVAMKTALHSLAGVPVASSAVWSTPVVDGPERCARLGARADTAVLAFAVSPAAGAPLPR